MSKRHKLWVPWTAAYNRLLGSTAAYLMCYNYKIAQKNYVI